MRLLSSRRAGVVEDGRTPTAPHVGPDSIFTSLSPVGFLEAVAGPRLAARLTLWPADKSRAGKPLPTIGDAFRDAARRVERRARMRQWTVVGVLALLGGWTALT